MSTLVDAFAGFSEGGGLASVLKLASQGLQAYGAISQSRAEAEAIKAEGAGKLEQAKWQAGKLTREKRKALSRQRALYAKAGIEVSSGSPLAVMEETREEYDADISQTMRSGLQSYTLSRKAAKNVKQAGWWEGGATILSSLAQFSQSSLLK